MGSEKLITKGIAEPKENWFKCPLELIEYLPYLSEKEVKVFLYIVRHTWGYHDDEKKITLDEFKLGRKKRNGERIDKGCGLSKPSIIGGLALLEKKGFINCRSSGDKAREKKFYSLRLKILTPETENIEQGSKIFTPEQPVRGKKSLHRSEKDTLIHKKKDTSSTNVDDYADAVASVGGDAETGNGIDLDLPFEFELMYANSPGDRGSQVACNHIVVKEDVEFGRLKRKSGRALCESPSKRFWGLVPATYDGAKADCKDCLKKAERIANPPLPAVHSQVIGIIASELARNDGNDFDELEPDAKQGFYGQAQAVWGRDFKAIHNAKPIDPSDFQAFCEARRARGWGFPTTTGRASGAYAQWLSNGHSIPEIKPKSQPRQSQYGRDKGQYDTERRQFVGIAGPERVKENPFKDKPDNDDPTQYAS